MGKRRKLAMGRLVKSIRLSNGLSQIDFGKKIGISNMSVSYIELGKKQPSIDTIRKIVKVFNVDATNFI